MKLKPIECYLNVMEFDEVYGDFTLKRVAISTKKTEKNILKDLKGDDDGTIVMRLGQYKHIFEQLFEEIARLNKQIEELNSND